MRGWRGPWLGLTLRAAELEPASLECRLRSAEALLACSRWGEAAEAFAAARVLDGDCLEAVCGEAAALDHIGRAGEATELWQRGRQATPHSAPPQSHGRSRWYVAAARARVAFGELTSAEDLLLVELGGDKRLNALQHALISCQSEYAAVLELHYLADWPTEGTLAASALPLPPASSVGRDKLSSAYDAWSLVLRVQPGNARAAVRLALVDAELAAIASAESEAR